LKGDYEKKVKNSPLRLLYRDYVGHPYKMLARYSMLSPSSWKW